MAAELARRALVSSLIASLLLGACAATRLDYESQVHVVRRGETLYTIAWQHGIDYRELASLNGLSNPNLIFPGQRLRLRPATDTRSGIAARPPPATPAPSRRKPPAQPPALPQPVWSWPTQGSIAARFGSSDGIGTGIAVSGTTGQPIRAAADGRIVYVGTGLVGYGELVIVKHNDAWLSAYGHTQNVIVHQGDSVAAGQRIASMGLGPRRQPRLHFEIRRNGVPVDPLGLLPSRR